MTLMAKLGEKAFLRSLLPTLPRDDNFINGFGHDISILDLGLAENIAFKIDRAPTPISVSNEWSDYRAWGRLAVVANVSDILAGAATPKAFMLSIVAPGSTEDYRLREIVTGCIESCSDYGMSFVGGDTKEGPSLQVVGACIGTASREYMLGRAVAQPGDHLVIAGSLGELLSAYLLLKNEEWYSDIDRNKMLQVLTYPKAKIDECRYIAERRLATAS